MDDLGQSLAWAVFILCLLAAAFAAISLRLSQRNLRECRKLLREIDSELEKLG